MGPIGVGPKHFPLKGLSLGYILVNFGSKHWKCEANLPVVEVSLRVVVNNTKLFIPAPNTSVGFGWPAFGWLIVMVSVFLYHVAQHHRSFVSDQSRPVGLVACF